MSKVSMKFVEELQPLSPSNPVKLSLRRYSDSETEVIAEDAYGNRAILLGIRADGTVARYLEQKDALSGMGFQTQNGYVKMFN